MRSVTVATGGPDDVFRGALVTWRHVPRGGYGYVYPVDAVVVVETYGRGPTARVRIKVKTAQGAEVMRTVAAASLRWRR